MPHDCDDLVWFLDITTTFSHLHIIELNLFSIGLLNYE